MIPNLSLQEIQKQIYTIRGYQVILDSDLAQLYGSEIRILNQAVRRNRNRFPSDFVFQLTSDEFDQISHMGETLNIQNLRSQSVILKNYLRSF